MKAVFSCIAAALSKAPPEASSSSEPVTPMTDHSSPSGYEEAKPESIAPVTSVSAASIASTFFSGTPAGISSPFSALSSISGRVFQTNESTAPVTRPSTMPIARCIGCISSTNDEKGSAVMPEASVSRTTEKAPSCRATTTETTEASVSRPEAVPFFISGLKSSG